MISRIKKIIDKFDFFLRDCKIYVELGWCLARNVKIAGEILIELGGCRIKERSSYQGMTVALKHESSPN